MPQSGSLVRRPRVVRCASASASKQFGTRQQQPSARHAGSWHTVRGAVSEEAREALPAQIILFCGLCACAALVLRSTYVNVIGVKYD